MRSRCIHRPNVCSSWPRAQTIKRSSPFEPSSAAFRGQVSLTYLTEETVPLLLSAVRAIPPGSVILYIWHAQRDSGGVMYPDAVARLVADAATVPVYGTSDLYIGTGVVGGVMRGTRETGTRIGDMALRILTGTRPQDIPIETARVMPVIDWRQVQRWGIDPSRLPARSQIVFREPSAWERYRALHCRRRDGSLGAGGVDRWVAHSTSETEKGRTAAASERGGAANELRARSAISAGGC